MRALETGAGKRHAEVGAQTHGEGCGGSGSCVRMTHKLGAPGVREGKSPAQGRQEQGGNRGATATVAGQSAAAVEIKDGAQKVRPATRSLGGGRRTNGSQWLPAVGAPWAMKEQTWAGIARAHGDESPCGETTPGLMLAEMSEHGLVHRAGRRAKAGAQALGRKAKISGQPFHAADIKETWADITKAKRVFSWEPGISQEEGFRLAVNWHVQNREWLKDIQL